MNQKIVLSILLFCASVLSATAQVSDKKKFMDADNYFIDSNYTRALPLYLELLRNDPANSNLNYHAGICYLNSATERGKALEFLQKASSGVSQKYRERSFKEKHSPLSTWLYLGDAYHYAYQFDSAIAMYNKFMPYMPVNDAEMHDMLLRRIQICNNAKQLVSEPIPFKVQNLGPKINSSEGDYSAVVSADQSMLIFTSRRPGSTGGKLDQDGRYFEDIYYSSRKDTLWSDPVNMGPNVNTDGHEASISTSIDGQQLFIYKDDNGNGNIYYTSLKGDQWQTPVKLDPNINSKYWEPSCALSPDGETFYFSSDTLGGFGGLDIYRCKKLPNGKWSKAQNLGPRINTPFNEDAPFIQADGVTFYFSSQGHRTMGGYDIFKTTLSDSGFSEPVNMGYPLNTTGDDIFYVPTADNKHAYYSSFKEGGYGDKDIYYITLPGEKEADLTVYSGTITSIYGGVPEGTVITVTDNSTGEVVGTYSPNSSTGKYVFILPPGKNYNISYEAEGFLFTSDNVDVKDSSTYNLINHPIELSPIKVGTKVVLKNIFFKSGQSTLAPESQTELDKLENLLKKFPKLVVEISGHTDSQGGTELNQKLSEKRAQAVVDYLAGHGIERNRMKAVGYGETQPIAKNTNPDGSWNRKGMALNRRFEFKILSVDGPLDVVEPIKVPDDLKKNK
jgi:outer membrane protein OmpA-like peptidoglycan-associated protein/tetratricopeptide (TPR) repeat protein